MNGLLGKIIRLLSNIFGRFGLDDDVNLNDNVTVIIKTSEGKKVFKNKK